MISHRFKMTANQEISVCSDVTDEAKKLMKGLTPKGKLSFYGIRQREINIRTCYI